MTIRQVLYFSIYSLLVLSVESNASILKYGDFEISVKSKRYQIVQAGGAFGGKYPYIIYDKLKNQYGVLQTAEIKHQKCSDEIAHLKKALKSKILTSSPQFEEKKNNGLHTCEYSYSTKSGPVRQFIFMKKTKPRALTITYTGPVSTGETLRELASSVEVK